MDSIVRVLLYAQDFAEKFIFFPRAGLLAEQCNMQKVLSNFFTGITHWNLIKKPVWNESHIRQSQKVIRTISVWKFWKFFIPTFKNQLLRAMAFRPWKTIKFLARYKPAGLLEIKFRFSSKSFRASIPTGKFTTNKTDFKCSFCGWNFHKVYWKTLWRVNFCLAKLQLIEETFPTLRAGWIGKWISMKNHFRATRRNAGCGTIRSIRPFLWFAVWIALLLPTQRFFSRCS